MSEPNNAVVCLVVLVDSSLPVLSEWPEICANYVRALITRLRESYKPRPFRIACVCYASASTRPNPLLSRTYFMGAQELTIPLAKNPQRFGVGQTGAGTQGMAVLEGIVAAIELFDAFKEASTNITPRCHIVHIAACNPDGAERPLWNTSSTLDSVTWDTLPAEIRKRAINYSLVALRPSQKLTDFYNTVASGSTQNAWFETKSSHAVCLMGYPPAPKHSQSSQSASSQPSPTKRSMEAGSSPESKRARFPSKASPNMKHSPIPKSSEPRLTEPPAQPVAPSQAVQSTSSTAHSSVPGSKTATEQQNDHTTRAPSLAEAQRATLVQAYQRLQNADIAIKSREREIAEAERVGDHAKLAELRHSQEKDKILFVRLRDALMRAAASSKRSETEAPAKSQTSAPTNLISSDGPSSFSPKPTPSVPAAAGISRTRTPSQTQQPLPQAPIVPSGTSPQLAAQMQKLVAVNQHNRTPRTSAGNLPSQEQPPPSAIQAGTGRPPSEWKGLLAWKGTDPMSGQRREMQTWVALKLSPQADNVKMDTWPRLITLNPSATIVPPVNILHEWITSHSGMIAMLLPADQKTNDDNFRTLARLLAEKSMFALASWPGADGQLKNQLVLFPHRESLAGAYFPDGVPELPKSPMQPQPQPPAQQQNTFQTKYHALYQKLPPLHRARLDMMPPAQREEAMKVLVTVMLRNQKNSGQMIPQQQPGGMPVASQGSTVGQPMQPGMGMNVGNPFAGRPPAMFPTGQPAPPGHMQGASGMMGLTPQQMAMGGLSFNHMHNRTPSVGSNPMASVSPGMMQSFMQRNPDPSNPGM